MMFAGRRASGARRRRRRADGAERARGDAGSGVRGRRRGGAVGQASSRKRRGKSRGKHGKFAGRVVPEDLLRTEPLPRPSGNLHIVSAAHSERPGQGKHLQRGRVLQSEAMHDLNGVLRCRRTDDEKPIDVQLLTWLSLIYDHFGGKPLKIVSGYRNQRKQTSNHFKGRATDIQIEGVSPSRCVRLRRRWIAVGWGSVCIRAASSCTSTCARRPATAGSTTRRRIPTRPRSARPAAGSARSSRASPAPGGCRPRDAAIERVQ